MKAIMWMGVVAAVALGGCASDDGGDEETGEAQDAMLLFSGGWATSHMMQTRAFEAPIGSMVRVTASASESGAGCAALYSVEMVEVPSGAVLGIARSYPRGTAHTESWLSVGGKYRVQFSTMKPPKQCTLVGTVSVDLTPP